MDLLAGRELVERGGRRRPAELALEVLTALGWDGSVFN
jgi:hypothetical protein